MLKLETWGDLEALVTEDVPESLSLDYKDAAALGKSNQQRAELFKDVSAFANSAGGQISTASRRTIDMPHVCRMLTPSILP